LARKAETNPITSSQSHMFLCGLPSEKLGAYLRVLASLRRATRKLIESKLEAAKHLARTVHDLYFEPKYEDFRPGTIWSLPNAFTSAFKELEPIPQFKATAKLGEFLEIRFSQSFSPWAVSAKPSVLLGCHETQARRAKIDASPDELHVAPLRDE
jgi:hypothetical protein